MKSITTGLIAIVLITVASTRDARAQGAEERAAADALFQEAKKLLKDGHYGEACAKFAASQDVLPRLGTQLNLADCYEQQGRHASAWATFRAAASVAKKERD